MAKTFEQINEKIKNGTAVVFTAEEVVKMAKEKSISELAEKIDVVTTATFGPMCSSGAFLNFGHSDPPIKMADIKLNGVSAYGGLAAVDTYIGATQPSDDRGIEYGGAHVIEDLLDGKTITMEAKGYPTDCYPKKRVKAEVSLETLNQAYMFNPRNVYQNYAAAANSTSKTKYTYMGSLLPDCGNVMYTTAGELSPLLKDPQMRTIGVGTRIFLGGAIGYVAWEGTQAVNNFENTDGDDRYAGYTLSLIGDLKKMSSEFIRAAVMEKYGTSIFIGMGIPIPVLDEDMMEKLAVSNETLYTYVYDYGVPALSRPALKKVTYGQLRSGSIELNGKTVKTASLSSITKARTIAQKLKDMVKSGEFTLVEPIEKLPINDKFKKISEIGDQS
jgi:L-aspartate semialdehyde sulfurtransferase